MKEEHQKYLAELKMWMPWVFKRGEAYAHLKTEFPALSEAEAKTIVDLFEAGQPQLLQEEDTSPCSTNLDGDSWNAH